MKPKNENMEIRKWTTVDVFYNELEQKETDKTRRYLERIGYELQERDAGNGIYDYCDQYIKSGKTRYLEKVN